MTKICPICKKVIKNDDIVVTLLLSKYQDKEDHYNLELLGQTICSHLFCAQVKEK